MNGMIWWFAADGVPPLDFPAFWVKKGPGETWADDPTVSRIEVSM